MLLAQFSLAQQVAQQQQLTSERSTKSEETTEPKNAPKLAKEEKKFASQMLETSESAARGFESPMRSYVLLQIAQVYNTLDKAKARELLNDAFTASLGIQDDDRTKGMIQEEILMVLLPLSQSDVEERLPQAEPQPRKHISEIIIRRYAEKKEFAPAMELVTQISRYDEFPYGSAVKVLLAMPPEMTAEKQALFIQALNSYKNHEHNGVVVGDGSFTNMLVRFGPKMAPKLVLEAIDEILSQAKKSDDKSAITLSGAGGTASFGSNYEFQLFSLLPLLEQLDESRAKSLLEENQALKAQLDKLPNGLQSIDPSLTDVPSKNGGMSSSVGGSSQGAEYVGYELARKAEEIADGSEKSPEQAVAQAASLPVKVGDRRVFPRLLALQGIARRNVKKNPLVANQALDELVKALPDVPLWVQSDYLSSAARLYLQMEEQESVEKIVAQGFKLADKLLEKDTNADDPNKALKAWWPSVDTYRRFIEIQTKISWRSAVKMLAEIKDPEIRTMQSIMLSRAMLDLPVKRVMIVEKTKHSNSISVHSED
jgi:hypothetical protein